MANETTKETGNRTVMIQPGAHKKAQVAANLKSETLIEFISKAAEKAAEPILRKHGLDPAKLDAAS